MRYAAVKHTFEYNKKDGRVPVDSIFDETDVVAMEIEDSARYYSGFVIVPVLAQKFTPKAKKTATADVPHFERHVPQSYGTKVEVVLYDAKLRHFPIVFTHFVGAENYFYRYKVFCVCKLITGFDIPYLVIIFN